MVASAPSPAAAQAAQPAPTAGTCRKRGTMAGGSWISPANRLAIYLRDAFTCAYCGKGLHGEKPFNVTLDHLAARSNGAAPDHSPHNLVTACRACNSARQDKPWQVYATGGAAQRIRGLVRRKLNLALARAILNGTAGDPRTENKGV